MKKVLILLLLAFALVGCQNIDPIVDEEILNDNMNNELEGYVMVKSTRYADIYMIYFDKEDYKWYDDTFGELDEMGMYYLYTRIDVVPFYRLINTTEVMIYVAGQSSVKIFVKASDIHTIKIEV